MTSNEAIQQQLKCAHIISLKRSF